MKTKVETAASSCPADNKTALLQLCGLPYDHKQDLYERVSYKYERYQALYELLTFPNERADHSSFGAAEAWFGADKPVSCAAGCVWFVQTILTRGQASFWCGCPTG